MLRFLIDECCTPLLARDGQARGYDATHVAHRGYAGLADRDLLPLAVTGDYVLVTNNRADFLRLYRAVDLHPGLIIILPSVSIAGQRTLFALALDAIEARGGDLVNTLVEAAVDGTVNFAPLP